MRIAVTAATGRLGSATLPLLSEAVGPDNVVAVCRDPGKIDVPGIETRKGDYAQPAELVEAFAGIDTVAMISAPVVSGTDRVALHANVIDAARTAGVRKIIFTSVIGSAAEKETLFYPTQQISRRTEELIKASGLEWIVARNGLYLDLDLMHIRLADEEGGVYRNNGAAGRCGYILVSELAVALANLATHDDCNGEVVNLTGENRTQAELIAIANDVFGIDVKYEEITAEQCMDKFRAKPAYAARGEDVIQMLAGCFECIANGAFDVPSDFERAAARPPQTTRAQMEEVRSSQS